MDNSDDWSNHEAYTSTSIPNNQDPCLDVINNKMLAKSKKMQYVNILITLYYKYYKFVIF